MEKKQKKIGLEPNPNAEKKPFIKRILDRIPIEQIMEEFTNYFHNCDLTGTPYTLAGLANHIGVHKTTLWEYSKVNDDFKELYLLAKQRCEQQTLDATLMGKYNVIGGIFLLKTAFDYIEVKVVKNEDTFVDGNSDGELMKRRKTAEIDTKNKKIKFSDDTGFFSN